jgi:hypothetical protein
MSTAAPSTEMSTSEIATYRRLLRDKYEELDELLDGLPNAALVWKPFEASPWKGGCFSLGEIAAHGVSSTIYLFRRAEWVMGRREWADVEGDEGSEEFGPANHDLAYLQARVRRTYDLADQFLGTLSPADLDGSRPHPKRAREMTVRFDIQHAIEHLSQHIGHGQITRQLWALQNE